VPIADPGLAHCPRRHLVQRLERQAMTWNGFRQIAALAHQGVDPSRAVAAKLGQQRGRLGRENGEFTESSR